MSINFAVCNVSASWKLPEWENSIILVISDHGISIGEKFGERAYGAFCYDYTIKTFAYYLSKEFIPKNISSSKLMLLIKGTNISVGETIEMRGKAKVIGNINLKILLNSIKSSTRP